MLLDLAPVRKGRCINARSFAGLMELYEQNYLRLRIIAPDLCVADEMISSVPEHQDLFLSITERCKYTTMLRMTYQFGDDGRTLCEPDLHLKVYHDARVVEVQHLHSRSRGSLYLADMIEQKWLMNRFLYKWLGYCLYQGHYFHPMRHLKTGNI
ncbi:MAG: DUF1249 domain-containing protein [Gammaproteobacteria bacterium]|nr:DUF1249 domain-containing protein [Gammaproteobacteria bacterium]MDH3446829.1 DUF1249 domain-containing protein [Gammaproteobacteria bacterium]